MRGAGKYQDYSLTKEEFIISVIWKLLEMLNTVIYIFLFLQKKAEVEIIFCINIDGVQSKMVPFMKKKHMHNTINYKRQEKKWCYDWITNL